MYLASANFNVAALYVGNQRSKLSCKNSCLQFEGVNYICKCDRRKYVHGVNARTVMDVLLEAVESVLPAEPRSARCYGPFLPVVTQTVLGMGMGMGKSWAGGSRRTVRRPQQKKDLEQASAALARLQQSCVEDQECAHRGGWEGGLAEMSGAVGGRCGVQPAALQ